MSLTFTVRGETKTDIELRMLAPKRAPVVSQALKRVDERQHAKESDGFAVVGYSPTVWAEIPNMYAREIKAHEKDEKNKHPGTLDEFIDRFCRKNKPKRMRSKPYELADAADLCAEMARKAGWQRVRVDELLKG